MENKFIKLLFCSFEGRLAAEEEKKLREAVESSEELRRAMDAHRRLRDALQNMPPASFSPFFADRVVQRIKALEHEVESQGDTFASILYIFRRVVVVGVLASLSLFSYNLFTSDTFSISEAFGHHKVTIEEAFDPFMFFVEE